MIFHDGTTECGKICMNPTLLDAVILDGKQRGLFESTRAHQKSSSVITTLELFVLRCTHQTRKIRDCAVNFSEIYVQLYDFEKFCRQTK